MKSTQKLLLVRTETDVDLGDCSYNESSQDGSITHYRLTGEVHQVGGISIECRFGFEIKKGGLPEKREIRASKKLKCTNKCTNYKD